MLESRGSWRRERGGGGERASDSVSTGEVCGVTASPSQSVAVVVAQPAAPRWLMRLSGHTLPTTLLRRPHSTQPRPPQPRHALHALRGTVALKTSLVPHFGCLYEAIIPFARRRLCLANRRSEIAAPRQRGRGRSLQQRRRRLARAPRVCMCDTSLTLRTKRD